MILYSHMHLLATACNLEKRKKAKKNTEDRPGCEVLTPAQKKVRHCCVQWLGHVLWHWSHPGGVTNETLALIKLCFSMSFSLTWGNLGISLMARTLHLLLGIWLITACFGGSQKLSTASKKGKYISIVLTIVLKLKCSMLVSQNHLVLWRVDK